MNNKEKIREKVSALIGEALLEHTLFASSPNILHDLRKEYSEKFMTLIDSLQKAPVSNVWHDIMETPKFNEIVVFRYIDGVSSCQYCGQTRKDALGWAYFEDLLNLDNSCKISKDLQEPVNEEWEKAAEMYATEFVAPFEMYYSEDEVRQFEAQHEDSFKAGAQWQKQQIEKNSIIKED